MDNATKTKTKTAEPVDELMREIVSAVAGVTNLPATAIVRDRDALRRCIDGCFWGPSKNKLHLINRQGDLVEFSDRDSRKFVFKLFGHPIDAAATLKQAPALEPDDEKKMRKTVDDLAWVMTLDYIKLCNQRRNLTMAVDMFADAGRMEILDEQVRVVFTHKPYAAERPIAAPDIVRDFNDHFPEFSDFLTLLAAARFAADRKRAYLWLHCSSDWGKGLLLEILKSLGVVVEMSVDEIELLASGKPVGRQMTDFKRALVLWVDEFKKVKSEVKQLQNTINLAPKNQLTQTVEIYTKVFSSAEDVASLASDDYGIEGQFANRFNYIAGTAKINSRPLFKSTGQSRYFRAIATYVAGALNDKIAAYQSLGRDSAEDTAQLDIDAIYARHKIEHRFDRYETSLHEVAGDFRDWLAGEIKASETQSDYKLPGCLDGALFRSTARDWYLKRASAAFDYWVSCKIQRSQQVAISTKNSTVLRLMSDDGAGTKDTSINCLRGKETYKVGGKLLKIGQID